MEYDNTVEVGARKTILLRSVAVGFLLIPDGGKCR